MHILLSPWSKQDYVSPCTYRGAYTYVVCLKMRKWPGRAFTNGWGPVSVMECLLNFSPKSSSPLLLLNDSAAAACCSIAAFLVQSLLLLWLGIGKRRRNATETGILEEMENSFISSFPTSLSLPLFLCSLLCLAFYPACSKQYTLCTWLFICTFARDLAKEKKNRSFFKIDLVDALQEGLLWQWVVVR